MKKFLLLAFIILTACQTAPGEEKFVNPLFNQPLLPISRMAWKTYLSPTQIETVNEDYKEFEDCELLDNTHQSVTLKCIKRNGSANRTAMHTYQYELFPCDEYTCFYGTWEVKETTYDFQGEHISETWFAIGNPKLPKFP